MAEIPGLPKDMFEFMQKMWNPMSFPLPGMIAPTVDPNEIEKKINELKAVETWLTMNVGFVQMTIKTLQMQKAALESLTAAQPKAPCLRALTLVNRLYDLVPGLCVRPGGKAWLIPTSFARRRTSA